jgi:hypothetical protein
MHEMCPPDGGISRCLVVGARACGRVEERLEVEVPLWFPVLTSSYRAEHLSVMSSCSSLFSVVSTCGMCWVAANASMSSADTGPVLLDFTQGRRQADQICIRSWCWREALRSRVRAVLRGTRTPKSLAYMRTILSDMTTPVTHRTFLRRCIVKGNMSDATKCVNQSHRTHSVVSNSSPAHNSRDAKRAVQHPPARCRPTSAPSPTWINQATPARDLHPAVEEPP